MLDLLGACILGICCGSFTGFVPGIHVNTAGAIIFAASAFLLTIVSVEFLCVFMVSMSIAHAVIEFVPSMLLGVPQEGTALTILPGHRMVLEGRSKEAIRLTSLAGFGAIIVTVLMMPIFAVALPFLVEVTKSFTWLILLVGSVYMLKRMSNGFSGFLWASFLFFTSGLMGWIMLKTPVSSGLTLMCLFTGLFGISSMLFSLNETSFIPHQSKYYDLHLNKNMLKGIFVGGISGAILGFLPGFGPSQGSVIAISLSGGSDGGNDKNVLDESKNKDKDIFMGVNNNDIINNRAVNGDNNETEGIVYSKSSNDKAKEYYGDYGKNYNVYSNSSENGPNNELEFNNDTNNNNNSNNSSKSSTSDKKSGDEITNFLTAISGLNTSDTLFSLIAIYLIGNPRSGIAVYMSYLITDLTLSHLLVFISASLIAVSVSLMINLKLGDIFSDIMQKIDYKKLSITVIILMIAILYVFVFVYNAPIWYLTLVLIASTALGLLPHYLGSNKSHLMGVLIVPAMIIYMGII